MPILLCSQLATFLAMSALLIFGNRTAQEVSETAAMMPGNPFSRIERRFFSVETFESEICREAKSWNCEIRYHIGITDMMWKLLVHAHCTAKDWKPATIIHPSAFISPTASVGDGVFIAAHVAVSSDARIDDFSLVHFNASIGHDARIGSFSSILPGSRISGNASIGKRSMIGSNAFVASGVKIGDDCRVDAMTYVRHSLLDGYIASVRSPNAVKRVDI